MVDTPTLTEFGSPALVAVGDDVSTTALMRQRAAEHPGRLYCEYKSASGWWVPVTLGQFADQVTAVAKGLAALGVAQGDSVGLLASTRFEWSVFDFAIMASGGVTVPIYPSSSASQVEWIAGDATLKPLIVETPQMAAAMKNLPGTTRVLAIDGDAYPDLHKLTSPGKRILLFLPLAHVLARHLEILSMASGMTLGFSPSPTTLPADLKSLRPHWMLAVPRVLEAFYHTADARSGGGMKQRLFRWAADVSRRASVRRHVGRLGPLLAVQFRIADSLVLHKVREAMGGRPAVRGVGRRPPLPRARTLLLRARCHGSRGLRAHRVVGAGPTCNPQDTPRVGTVGLPLPGCTVRIADDGEVLIKGPNVFAGYHHRDDLTAEVLSDGWFASGDLGSLDADGYLHITGR